MFYALSLALYKAPPEGEKLGETNTAYTIDTADTAPSKHTDTNATGDKTEETGNGMGLSHVTGSGDNGKSGVSDTGMDGYYTLNGSKY